MPLSADSQALLELILAKGQSYEDLAGLLDVSEDEVRERARGALRELSGTDPDRNVALTDWILGQADPIGRAEAARHLREDPEDNRLAAGLLESLQELAPDAELPRLPGAPSARRARKTKAQLAPPSGEAAESSGPSRLSSLSGHQTRLIVAFGSAAVILIFVVLAVTGTFGGSDDSEGAAASDSTTTTASSDLEDAQRVPVEFKPVGGTDASGGIAVGVANQTAAFFELAVQDLQPPPSDSTYALWFMQNEKTGYPYQEVQVDAQGEVNERFSLPEEFLGAMLSSRSIDIWLSPRSELQRDVSNAIEKGALVDVPGQRVLTADISSIADAVGVGAGGQGDAPAPESP